MENSICETEFGEDQVFQPITENEKNRLKTSSLASRPSGQPYGKWRVVKPWPNQFSYRPLGAYLGPHASRWTLASHRLSLTSVNGTERTYHISIHQGRMRMSGGDLDKELILVRAK